MLVTALAGGIAGCGGNNQSNTDEEVVITWKMPGPSGQADAEKVWAEFNKKLKEFEGLENVTVKFDVTDASDYSQKFLMSQTGGDDMDIIQTYTLKFVEEVRNGSFAPLDEYLDDELKETKEELPEFIFKYGEVDGQIYGITNYQMCPNMYALNIDKELADKYLDINAVKELLAKPEFDEKIFDVLEPLLAGAQANGELGKGFNPHCSYMFASRLYDNIRNMFCIETYGDDNEVKMFFETPENKKVYDRMHDWFQKGYIRKDVLSVDNLTKQNGIEGGHIMWIANNYKGQDVVETKDGKERYVLYLSPNPLVPMNNAAGAIAISANSKHKEIAAKIINLMNCERGKDLYNLLVWGLEGEHYTKTGEDRIETIGYTGQGTSSAPYGLWKWVVGNTENAYMTQSDSEDYKEFVFDRFNEGEDTLVSRAIGFYPDLTDYQSQLAQLSSVDGEYTKPLMYGAVENYETVYAEFMDKIKKCNSDEIRDEIQRQLDEFMAAQK